MREMAKSMMNEKPKTIATTARAQGEYHGVAPARMWYTITNAQAATERGKTRFIKPGRRSFETLPQCWHLYSTSNFGPLLTNIVRDEAANVAASQYGQRNQDRRERLKGEAASIDIPCHLHASQIDPVGGERLLFGSNLSKKWRSSLTMLSRCRGVIPSRGSTEARHFVFSKNATTNAIPASACKPRTKSCSDFVR
jgi:hypothetical protein